MDNKITVTIQASASRLDAAAEQAHRGAFGSGVATFRQALASCERAALNSARAFSELERAIQDYSRTVAAFEAMCGRVEQLAWRQRRSRVVARLGAGLSLALILASMVCV